jgi:cell division protein FtsB
MQSIDTSIITAIVAPVVLMIIGFLFGKSGILTRFSDVRLRKIEVAQKQEENTMDDLRAENQELKKQVSELKSKVHDLENELTLYKERLDVMQAYFEKVNPAPDPFFDKITKKGKK